MLPYPFSGGCSKLIPQLGHLNELNTLLSTLISEYLCLISLTASGKSNECQIAVSIDRRCLGFRHILTLNNREVDVEKVSVPFIGRRLIFNSVRMVISIFFHRRCSTTISTARSYASISFCSSVSLENSYVISYCIR